MSEVDVDAVFPRLLRLLMNAERRKGAESPPVTPSCPMVRS